MIVGKDGNCSTNNTASHPRKIESSKSEVPQLCILLVSRILILESSFVSKLLHIFNLETSSTCRQFAAAGSYM
jgi:hypothetical protein